MIDDKLTLPAADPPEPDAKAVTLFALDDGDGIARLYALTGDGVQHELTPAPYVAPTYVQRLTTPGFHGPTLPRTLVTDEPVVARLGAVDHDVPAGTVVEIAWGQLIPATVGWGQVALLMGPPSLGNPQGMVVGWADAKPALASLGTISVSLTTLVPIPAGATVRVALAVWSPPGAVMPQLIGSAYADPIASGDVARQGVPGWQPSQVVGAMWTFDAQAGTRPVAMAVLIP